MLLKNTFVVLKTANINAWIHFFLKLVLEVDFIPVYVWMYET